MLLIFYGNRIHVLVVKHFDRFLNIILHNIYFINRLDDLKPKRIQFFDFQAVRCTITQYYDGARFC